MTAAEQSLLSETCFDQPATDNESKEADYKPKSEPEYRKWFTVVGGFLVCLREGFKKRCSKYL